MKGFSSAHTSMSREAIGQPRQLKPPKPEVKNDAPERFENVFLKKIQETQKEMMKEDWAKQGRKNFFKKTIKGGLAEQLLQHNPGMPLPPGLELNPMEESLMQIPLIKGRREKEIQNWLIESNFQKPDILNKF